MAMGEAGGAVQRPQRTPNAVLRAIRENERHESQSQFAEAMSRVAREIGAEVYPDGQYVQRLESGHITWPHRTYRNILETLCGRPVIELGFAPLLRSSAISTRVNALLRDAIWASGMEVTDFARTIGVDPKTAERWITRGMIPQPFRRWKASLILGIDESELWPGAIPYQETPECQLKVPRVGLAKPGKNVADITTIEEDQEEMERRRLLQSLTVLGVSVSPLGQALETVRTAFGKTVGYDERNHLDYWEEATVEYGYSYLYTSPAELVPDLAADILAVRSIVRRIPDRDSADYHSWCRVGGTLSALMAKSLSNLGYARHAREWWSMAHHLADSSGDRDLAILVRGEHIIHGLYENRPIPVLLRQLESAAEITGNRPCTGLLDLTGARAQVSVLAGDYHSAEEDLRSAQEILGRIPQSSPANGTGLVMLWGEAELRYTEAWVYSRMGDKARTDRAADRAFSLYPASDRRSPVQIKLMQAFTRVSGGDITEGIQHAQAAYEPLAFERTTMVDALARSVLNAIPAEAWKRSDAAEYRELVMSREAERRAIEA